MPSKPFSRGLRNYRLQTIKFYMKTPYYKLAKIYTNCSGHMTKIATMPTYVNNPLKIFSRTRRQMTKGLCMLHWGCGPYQDCTNDDPRLTLTYFTTRSNLFPAFIWEKSWNMHCNPISGERFRTFRSSSFSIKHNLRHTMNSQASR